MSYEPRRWAFGAGLFAVCAIGGLGVGVGLAQQGTTKTTQVSGVTQAAGPQGRIHDPAYIQVPPPPMQPGGPAMPMQMFPGQMQGMPMGMPTPEVSQLLQDGGYLYASIGPRVVKIDKKTMRVVGSVMLGGGMRPGMMMPGMRPMPQGGAPPPPRVEKAKDGGGE